MNFIGVTEAAEAKSTTRQTVYKAIKANLIDGVLVGRSYVVKDNVKLARWAPDASKQKGGRARAKKAKKAKRTRP